MAEAAVKAPEFAVDANGKRRRVVAESWYIGETLGKGGFGFVKMGYHKKNGKEFALKFIRKADSEDPNAKQQATLVATEINCLIRVSNPYVLKLFAYRTSCLYPQRDGTNLTTIMLVLELARGGDLFDILYYTKKLKLDIARTYFYQLAEGLKAIHDAGICHRDLKPQNLLLNSKFELKITDFGLSKMFEEKDGKDAKNKKRVMKTWYAGTQGYQAPEQILKRNFTPKCDVFSCGVILFILLTGYPPCHQAHYSDPFYKYIAQVQYDKFWLKHRLNKVLDEQTRDIMNKTMCYQPTDRFTAKDMLEHPWVQDKAKRLTSEQLQERVRELYVIAMQRKAKDAKKVEKLQGASKLNRAVAEFGEIPVWTHRAIPKGRSFVLKQGENEKDIEAAKRFLDFLDRLMIVCKGSVVFKPKEVEIQLKITMVDPDDEDIEKEDIAYVNVYKMQDGPLFAVFTFPNHMKRHQHEEEIYETYAGALLPDWMDRIENKERDELHLTAIKDLQDNNEKFSDAFKQAAVKDHKATAEELDELADACMMTPIDFKLPTMADWLIPRVVVYLDLKKELKNKEFSESEGVVDDEMMKFFSEMNAANPGFEEAQKNKQPAPVIEDDSKLLPLQKQ